MQRQKTIAKWLAIILLLTIIVASYFVLNAVVGKQNSSPKVDVAGADDQGGSSHPNPIKPSVTAPPVYSTFPRDAEVIDGLTVRHIGGDKDERLLDNVYLGGKRLIVFQSFSAQYDVRESGIHMAVFDGDKLTSTVKIAGNDEQFIDARPISNGLLILTKTDTETKLRLFDINCKMIATNSCVAYSSYILHLSGITTTLFAADEHYIYAMNISNSLELTKCNFVYSLNNASICHTLDFKGKTTLIVQANSDICILTFDTISGFSCKSELVNCRFTQLLPFSSDNNQSLVVSAQTEDGTIIVSIDSSLHPAASYLIKGSKSVVCLAGESNNILVVSGQTLYTFCSHLELQSTSAITLASDIISSLEIANYEEIYYCAVNGEKNIFILSHNDSFAVVSLDGLKIKRLFSAVGNSPLITRESPVNGISPLSVIFDGSGANAFGYMSFGANDVFYVTLSSQLTE